MSDGAQQRGAGPAVDGAAATAIARVVTDEPAAVLLVDLDAGEVVYANRIAGQLAPVALPAPVAAWSEAAGLRTEVGEELEQSPTPLERVAAGEPVHGEVVTAERGADFSAARERLWVVGTPLVGAPGPLAERALVVFLPLRNQDAVANAQQAALDLRNQAVVASEVAFTISDPHAEDDPLVWVNPAFERATGYRAADVIGTNCRFLQGPLTDPAAVQRIRDGLLTERTITETLLNYRADGTAFWNRLVISPIFGADGTLTHHVGVQTDVTDRIDADLVRDAALALAENASRRQQSVAAISTALAAHWEDPDELLAALPGLITSHFWGWCAVVLLAPDGELGEVVVAYGEPPSTQPSAGRSTGYAGHRDPELAAQVISAYLQGPGARLVQLAGRTRGYAGDVNWPQRDVVEPEDYTGLAPADPDALVPGMADSADGRSLIAAPLLVRGRAVGLVTLSRPGTDELTDPADAAALADVAMRAGTAWDHARLYAAEHDAALTLQRSLLPRLPQVPGFDIAATYIPATTAEVGGDWFDVVDLPGPWLSVVIGDVMGHDMRAAATMGQLRSIVRTLAWQGLPPAELLAQTTQIASALESGAFATMFYAIIDDPAAHDGVATVRYASAGHLPALVRLRDGSVSTMNVAPCPPIGVQGGRPITADMAQLPDGAALVLFTDGLVERRGRSLDEGLAAIGDALRTLPAGVPAADILGHVTELLADGSQEDDTCLLVIVRDDATRSASVSP